MIQEVTSCCNKPDGWLTWSELNGECQKSHKKTPHTGSGWPHTTGLIPSPTRGSRSGHPSESRHLAPRTVVSSPFFLISDSYISDSERLATVLCWLFNARTFDSNSLLRAHHPKITNYVVTKHLEFNQWQEIEVDCIS